MQICLYLNLQKYCDCNNMTVIEIFLEVGIGFRWDNRKVKQGQHKLVKVVQFKNKEVENPK